MARTLKPAREIEKLLLDEVRQERECETVSSISIYVYPEANEAHGANWAPSSINYDRAGELIVDQALARAVDRLQRKYDAIPHD
jgi:hypothetical protein